jgi:hypothetical protein
VLNEFRLRFIKLKRSHNALYRLNELRCGKSDGDAAARA